MLDFSNSGFMKGCGIFITAILLLSCHQHIYYSVSDQRLNHSVGRYEDYGMYGIEKLYYPPDSNAFFRNWQIFKDQSKNILLAKCYKQKEGYTLINYWENGKYKEIKNYNRKREVVEWTCYCESGVKAFTSKGLGYPVDTIYFCNGKFQYVFNRHTEQAVYFDANGDTTMFGHYKDDYKKDGLWVNNQRIGYMKKYEIYIMGQKTYQGDSIPPWFHK